MTPPWTTKNNHYSPSCLLPRDSHHVFWPSSKHSLRCGFCSIWYAVHYFLPILKNEINQVFFLYIYFFSFFQITKFFSINFHWSKEHLWFKINQFILWFYIFISFFDYWFNDANCKSQYILLYTFCQLMHLIYKAIVFKFHKLTIPLQVTLFMSTCIESWPLKLICLSVCVCVSVQYISWQSSASRVMKTLY